MQSRLLLDIIICHGSIVFELLSCKNETLLIRGDALLVRNLRLHVRDGVSRLHLEGDRLTRKSLHENLHFIITRVFSLIDIEILVHIRNHAIRVPLRNLGELGVHVITQL